MRRLSVLTCCATLAAAAFVLNCGDDEDPIVVTPGGDSGVSPGVDSGGQTPTDGSTPPAEAGGNDAGDGGSTPTGYTVYGVDEDNKLVRFTTGAPGTVTSVSLTGLGANESLHGIDFRPRTGQLYALGSTGAVYTIAVATGAATTLAGGDAGVTTFPLVLDPLATSYGFDFNPVADRIRVHTNTGKNYRLHPANGESVNVAGDPDLVYVDGGSAATIVATAYNNSVSATPTATRVWGIDPTANQLVTFDTAPGFAEASAVGALGVDVEDVAGFDIRGGVGGGGDSGVPEVNQPIEAFAALRVAGTTGLYTVNLSTGAATLVGTIGHPKALRGISVQP